MDLSKYSNKIVLVTGGTGFIGTNLCIKLAELGAKIHIVHKNREKTKLRKLRIDKKPVYHVLDISNPQKVDKILKKIKPDYIFHLAADVDRERSVEKFRESLDTNAFGLLNILQSLVARGGKTPLVVAGTAEEYGNNKTPFKENMQENPNSPYSLSKVVSTYMARAFYNIYAIPLVILRATIAYGPGQQGDMFLPSILAALNSDKEFKMTLGEQTRDFIYIDDLIAAYLIAALSTQKIAGETINIGYGRPHKLKEVAKEIGDILGKAGKIKYGAKPYRVGEIMHYYVDNSKAKKVLGWKPKITFREGLKRLTSYVDKNET